MKTLALEFEARAVSHWEADIKTYFLDNYR